MHARRDDCPLKGADVCRIFGEGELYEIDDLKHVWVLVELNEKLLRCNLHIPLVVMELHQDVNYHTQTLVVQFLLAGNEGENVFKNPRL